MGKKMAKKSAALAMMIIVLSTGVVVNAEETYTVETGDYLRKIAQSVYGDTEHWKDIYEANKAIIKNPDVIYRGQVLILPEINSAPAADAENPAEMEAVHSVMTLEQWVMSQECREIEKLINDIMKDTGLVVALKADGNVFVYEFCFSQEMWGGASAEEMKAAFGGSSMEDFLGTQRELFISLAQEFDEVYGIKLDGIRYVYTAPDGVPFHSAEFMNE